MSRWKLFDRFKSKEEVPHESEEMIECEKESKEESTPPESEETVQEEPEESTLVEYRETLHTEGSTTKKKNTTASDQRVWRDMNTIEKNIDNLRKTKKTKPRSELDKTVDKILSKSKKK